MKIRKTRCVGVSAVVVLLYIAVLSILNYSPTQRYLVGIQDHLQIDFSDFGLLFRPEESQFDFNEWARKIFDKHMAGPEEAVRMARFMVDDDSPRARARDKVPLPEYLSGNGDNPHLVPFDARLTLGIVLAYVNEQLASGVPHNKLQLDTFHWADWVDLSVLQAQMLAVGADRLDCDSLITTSNSRPTQKDVSTDALTFCVDEKRLDAWKKKYGKTSLNAYLEQTLKAPQAGFHVFQYPKRSSLEIVVRAAQSYVNDFMPAPLAVHLLLPKATVLLQVAQEVLSRVRLVDTPTAASLAERQLEVDLRAELERLALRVDSSGPAWNYTRDLEHADFVDQLADHLRELSKNYALTPSEKHYFESLHASLLTKLPTKYFFEAELLRREKQWNYGAHYDWRFFKGIRNNLDVLQPSLHALILAWLRFTASKGITTWLAHGTLLSWYWNGMSFPWDADIDVQMPVVELHKLARHYNQSVVVDFGADSQGEVRTGRFLVDCGTWISTRDTANGLNNIDARFIDLDSGLYIDITALAVLGTIAPMRYKDLLPKQYQREPKDFGKLDPAKEIEINTAAHLYNCRNKHFLALGELLPLRLTAMEGVPAYIPNDFVSALQVEYGTGGTGSQKFKLFAFLPRIRLWNSAKMIARYSRTKGTKEVIDLGNDAKTAQSTVDKLSVFNFSDQDYLELLASEPDILVEYLVSKDVTALHEQEMRLLLKKQSAENVFLDKGQLRLPMKLLRRDVNNYVAFRDNVDFSKQVEELQKQYEAFKEQKRSQTEDVEADKDDIASEDEQPKMVSESVSVEAQTEKMAKDESRTRPDL